jgi:hypothetical protein
MWIETFNSSTIKNNDDNDYNSDNNNDNNKNTTTINKDNNKPSTGLTSSTWNAVNTKPSYSPSLSA